MRPSPKSLIISPVRKLYSLKSKTFSATASTISHCNPNGSGEKDKGAIPFRAANFPDTMKEKEELEKAMQEYIAELEVDGVISRSHFTLRRLHNRFGKEAVEGWLKNHFDNK